MEVLNIGACVSLTTVEISVRLGNKDKLPNVKKSAVTKVFEPAAERVAGCEKQQVPQRAMQKTRRNP